MNSPFWGGSGTRAAIPIDIFNVAEARYQDPLLARYSDLEHEQLIRLQSVKKPVERNGVRHVVINVTTAFRGLAQTLSVEFRGEGQPAMPIRVLGLRQFPHVSGPPKGVVETTQVTILPYSLPSSISIPSDDDCPAGTLSMTAANAIGNAFYLGKIGIQGTPATESQCKMFCAMAFEFEFTDGASSSGHTYLLLYTGDLDAVRSYVLAYLNSTGNYTWINNLSASEPFTGHFLGVEFSWAFYQDVGGDDDCTQITPVDVGGEDDGDGGPGDGEPEPDETPPGATCVGDDDVDTRDIEQGDPIPVGWISYVDPIPGYKWTDWCVRVMQYDRRTNGTLYNRKVNKPSSYYPDADGLESLLAGSPDLDERKIRIKFTVAIFKESQYDIGETSGNPTHWRSGTGEGQSITARQLGYCLKICWWYI